MFHDDPRLIFKGIQESEIIMNKLFIIGTKTTALVYL